MRAPCRLAVKIRNGSRSGQAVATATPAKRQSQMHRTSRHGLPHTLPATFGLSLQSQLCHAWHKTCTRRGARLFYPHAFSHAHAMIWAPHLQPPQDTNAFLVFHDIRSNVVCQPTSNAPSVENTQAWQPEGVLTWLQRICAEACDPRLHHNEVHAIFGDRSRYRRGHFNWYRLKGERHLARESVQCRADRIRMLITRPAESCRRPIQRDGLELLLPEAPQRPPCSPKPGAPSLWLHHVPADRGRDLCVRRRSGAAHHDA